MAPTRDRGTRIREPAGSLVRDRIPFTRDDEMRAWFMPVRF